MNAGARRAALLALVAVWVGAELSGLRESADGGVPLEPLEGLEASFADDQIDYFFELAFGTGDDQAILRRWTDDLRIGLAGEPTAADREAVDLIAAALEAELHGLRVRRVRWRPNVKIYYASPASFRRYEPNYRRGRSFFWCWWNRSGEIERARIMLPSVGVSQRTRDHLLAKNLIRVLGPMARSSRRDGGLLASRRGRPVLVPDRLDRAVLALHYHPRIHPGVTRQRLGRLMGHGEPATASPSGTARR